MIYDSLDFFLLKEIYISNEITTWQLAKKYSWENNEIKNEEFFLKKCDLICKRLKRMAKEDLIFITKEKQNRSVYNLNLKNVIFKNRHKFPNGFGKALFLKEKDKKWQVYQL